MLEMIAAGLIAMTVISTGIAAWMAHQVFKLKREVSERDDLIEDLRAALGGAEDKPDWRNLTL